MSAYLNDNDFKVLFYKKFFFEKFFIFYFRFMS